MRQPRHLHSRRAIARSLAVSLGLVALAGPLVAQADEEPRVERRIQVVFSDDEGSGEQHIWVDSDGSGPMLLPGAEGETILHAPFLHSRAYLGVNLLDITPELRQHFGASADAGILVASVADDSPAASAGIEVGDVLTTIDGEEVKRSGQVLRKLGGRDEGATVEVGLVRDRRSLSVKAILAERPRSQVDLAPMFWLPSDGDRRVLRLPHRILEIEKGDLDEAFSELHERLESPEWRSKLEETTSRRLTLENRIRELEKRLREMEKRLEEDSN